MMKTKLFGLLLSGLLAAFAGSGCVAGTGDEGDVDGSGDGTPATETEDDVAGGDEELVGEASQALGCGVGWEPVCGGWHSAGTCSGGNRLKRYCWKWVCGYGSQCCQFYTEYACIP